MWQQWDNFTKILDNPARLGSVGYQHIQRHLRCQYRWDAGKAVTWQAVGLLLVWAYVSLLHAGNDGLWPHGDAARHAANGAFFWDFLTHLPVNPVQFALRYYVRYPVIHPTAYPPAFYLLEGVAFALFGVSPLVAKSLVLLFTLVGGIYTMAWLRRWVAQEAGWGGVLLLLLPGVIEWSHAIMLNIPAMTLSLAALYHTRRWLESPASRSLYLAFGFALLTPLTYVPAGLTLVVILAWILAERCWVIWRDRRVWLLTAAIAVGLGPWVLIGMRWAPMHTLMAFPNLDVFRHPWTHLYYWLYYAQRLPGLFRVELFGVIVLGIVMGVWDRPWRRELKWLLIWGAVCYFGLSCIWVRAPRYALLLAPPAVLLGVGGVFSCCRWLSARLHRQTAWLFGAAIASVLLWHLAIAHQVQVPVVKGFQETVAFLERQAPGGFIFYDGRHDGIFSFYVRAGDSHYKRGIVLGDKLLYTSAVLREWGLTERVTSAAEVLEALHQQCGCQWLVIARVNEPPPIAAVRYLHEVLKGPEFQLVHSFPIVDTAITHLDVYRFLPTVVEPAERVLPFLNLGPGTVLRAKPIEQ